MSPSEALFLKALKVLPGGVSRDTVLRSPHPLYVAKGSGCVVTDIEGREFIDFANNMASLIHGHAFAPIIAAVTKQMQLGTCFSFGTEVEVEFAEHMCSRSTTFEKIRFMNSGTEAVMAAVKAARAFTGRPKIAKVEGAYHGAYDYVEISQMSGPDQWGRRDAPRAVPLAAGTPQSVADDVIVIPFNDTETTLRLLNDHAASIAGVLIDPIPHRVGLIPADPAYIKQLREWTRANGSLLVFDEVITFRTEVGGTQARYEVTPDLTALGKAIGGGFPIGAVAGSNEAMAVFAAGDKGLRLPQSGTFSANPITMTAGLVAMQHYDRDGVSRINRLADQARTQVKEAIKVSGVPACVTGCGSMLRVHLGAKTPQNYRDAYLDSQGKMRLAQFVKGASDNGVTLTNTGTAILSTVMAQAHIDRLANAVLASLRKLA